MGEVVLLPEMLDAGVQALEEAKGYSSQDQVIAVYLAMRGLEEIALMRLGTVH